MLKDQMRVSRREGRVQRPYWRGLMHESSGASAAEFALILVPMVFILVLSMQFGMLLFVHNDMFNAARSSARVLALNEFAIVSSYGGPTACGSQTEGSIEDVACDHLANWQGLLTSFNVDVNVTPVDGCDQVEVIVTAPMDQATLFNLFGVFTGRTLTANMILRSQHDVIETGGSDPIGDAASGNCNIEA